MDRAPDRPRERPRPARVADPEDDGGEHLVAERAQARQQRVGRPVAHSPTWRSTIAAIAGRRASIHSGAKIGWTRPRASA
jgi:hypothetical protein